MLFNVGSLSIVLSAFFVIWLSVMTVLVFRMLGHYNKLTDGVSKQGLREILEAILKREEGLRQETQELGRVVDALSKNGVYHIQKIGLVRFNPFLDTGGSQSFTLAILDGSDNGLVMTSLYARSGNRWYIKEVRMGKGKELELSKEEQAAIRRAQTLSEKHV